MLENTENKAKDFLWDNLEEESRLLIIKIIDNNSLSDKEVKIRINPKIRLDVDLV